MSAEVYVEWLKTSDDFEDVSTLCLIATAFIFHPVFSVFTRFARTFSLTNTFSQIFTVTFSPKRYLQEPFKNLTLP